MQALLDLGEPRVAGDEIEAGDRCRRDGFTQLVWGATGMRDFSLLRPPTQQYIKPEVGKLLVFPNWLLHRVEPFFGEGERRTLSCNMDVAFDEPSWY